MFYVFLNAKVVRNGKDLVCEQKLPRIPYIRINDINQTELNRKENRANNIYSFGLLSKLPDFREKIVWKSSGVR